MKREGVLKMIAAAFVIALVLYAIAYTAIEHRRNRLGPWQVTFTTDDSDTPLLEVSQPSLAISNVRLLFPGHALPSNFAARTIAFDDPRQVPYDLPFGQCIFMDTTFLPGTIVMNLFGHEIQLIPRVLTVDKEERPWRSGEMIRIGALATNTP